MARIGKHKAKYDKYKNTGRKAINKDKKAKRNEKLIGRFAKRREDGKSYEYDKSKSAKKIADAGYDVSSDFFKENEQEIRRKVFGESGNKTSYSKLTSNMRKLQNELDRIKKEAKDKKTKKQEKAA